MRILPSITFLCIFAFMLISLPYPRSGNYVVVNENNKTYCAPSYENSKGNLIYCSNRLPSTGYCPSIPYVYVWIYNNNCHYQENYVYGSKIVLIGIGTILFAIVLSSSILYLLYSLVKEGIINLICSGLSSLFCGINSLFLRCFCKPPTSILPI